MRRGAGATAHHSYVDGAPGANKFGAAACAATTHIMASRATMAGGACDVTASTCGGKAMDAEATATGLVVVGAGGTATVMGAGTATVAGTGNSVAAQRARATLGLMPCIAGACHPPGDANARPMTARRHTGGSQPWPEMCGVATVVFMQCEALERGRPAHTGGITKHLARRHGR